MTQAQDFRRLWGGVWGCQGGIGALLIGVAKFYETKMAERGAPPFTWAQGKYFGENT